MSHNGLSAGLLADIYAAAIDEDAWPAFSTLLEQATGIEAVSVWITDSTGIVDASVSPVYQPLLSPYQEHFSKVDPWAANLVRHPFDAVMFACEHLPDDELVKTEFYNDYARPGGLHRPMRVRMDLGPGVYATMGSDNPFAKTLFEESDKQRVRAILPHVKSALKLRRLHQQTIARLNACTSVSTAALDAYSFGVVICDTNARVVFANAATEGLVRQGAGLVLGHRGKSLAAVVPSETTALLGLIRDAAGGGAGGAIRLTGRNDAAAILGLVTPLPRQLSEKHGPGHALLSLRSAHHRPSSTAGDLATMFRLSPTQASIALAIFNGKTPEGIAAARGIKITTMRTHLADIFVRTETVTQRDLIRLLGSLPPLR